MPRSAIAAALALLIALPAAAAPDSDTAPPGRPALPAIEARLLALRAEPRPEPAAPLWLEGPVELGGLTPGYYFNRPPSLALKWRASPPAFEEMLKTARDLLGMPYVWGGTGPDGFDCSGFVNKVFAENGYALPRVSRDMARVGAEVRREDLAPGDLMFWTKHPAGQRINHVGMYIGGDEFIHAAYGQGEVVLNNLKQRYYDQRFKAARRVLGLPPGVLDPDIGGDSRPPERLDGAVEGYRPGAVPSGDTGTTAGIGTATGTGTGASAGAGTGTEAGAGAGSGTGTATGTGAGAGSGTGTATGTEAGAGSGTGVAVGAGSGAEAGAATVETEEHTEAQPFFMKVTAVKSVIADLGPRRPVRPSSNVGLKLGFGYMDGTSALLIAPALNLFFPDYALRTDFGFALGLAVAGDEQWDLVNRGDYADWRRYTTIIQQVRLGQKEAPLYIDLDRTAVATLGHGQVLRNYAPNVSSRQVPGWNLRADALSLQLDGYMDYAGGEIFIDDVFDPTVFGLLLFAYPFGIADAGGGLLRSLSAGLTYAVDRDAPYFREYDQDGTLIRYSGREAVHALGVDIESKLYKSKTLDLKLYIDSSTLILPETHGTGGALGTLLRIKLVTNSAYWLRFRVEGRVHQATFLPSYFDATYQQERYRAGIRRPTNALEDEIRLPKLGILERRDGGPSAAGFYAEGTFSYKKRFNLGVVYEDEWFFDNIDTEELGPRSLAFSLDWRYIPVYGATMMLDLYLAYHLRHFTDGDDFFQFDTGKEYLFAAASLKLWKYFFLNAGVRAGYSQPDDEVAVDVTVDLSLEFPF